MNPIRRPAVPDSSIADADDQTLSHEQVLSGMGVLVAIALVAAAVLVVIDLLV